MNKIFLLIIAVFLSGFVAAQTYLISTMPASVSTCSGTFYDSGGSGGNYANNETYTKTFCSSTPGSQILFHFTSFNSESYDKLIIYDGATTAGNILINASGLNPGTIVNQTFSSSNGCLTFKWTSDVSTVKAGWAADITCTFPCQPYTIKMVNPSTPFVAGGDTMIHICQNTPLTLHVAGTYPPPGQYTQSDATTTFTWTYGDGTNPPTVSGVGMTTLTHTWPEGAYYVTVKSKDVNNCANSNLARIMVLVSTSPTFGGTNITPDTICPGETVVLDGQHLQAHPWTTIVDTMVSQTTALYDGVGQPYDSPITNTLFNSGQTLTNVNNLQSVCLNMEHSYPGDLTIQLFCPSGQHVDLLLYSDGLNSAFFGEPIDDDTNTNPGIGYTYCWTPTATQTMAQAYALNQTYTFTDLAGTTYTNHQHIAPGNYIPQGPNGFSALQGCSLNGSWVIHVIDNLSSDNGYIFNWQLHFNPAIIPPQFTFSNTHDSAFFSWSGSNIISQNNGLGTATPIVSGTNQYTFTVIDDYNCSYDTIVGVYVRPLNSPQCCIMPSGSAGNDTSVCSAIYTFNATMTPGNTGVWSLAPGAPGTAVIASPTSPNSLVTANGWGTYKFVWAETYLGQAICTSRDTVAVSFNQTPTSSFTIDTIKCHGNNTMVNFTGTAQQDPVFTWNWDGGNHISGIDGGTHVLNFANADTFNLSLTVVQHGCSSPVTTVSVVNPDSLVYTKTVINNPCFGDSKGKITLTVTGGTPPYIYDWLSGINILDQLPIGSYVVNVTDINNCTFKDSTFITEPALITYDTAFKNINCFGGNDGIANVFNVLGGTGAFTYTWNPILTNAGYQGNLLANNYTVIFHDANNCTDTVKFILTQPPLLTLTVTPDISICEGGATTIEEIGNGGVPPYTYLWNGAAGPSSQIVSPATTTIYVAQIEDSYGCFTPNKNIKVTVSPYLKSIFTLKQVTCSDSCNGKATITVQGGITPLIYHWNSLTNVSDNLCDGLYFVTVEDQIGCDTALSFVITKPSAITFTTNTTPTSCYGKNDGDATVTAQGGTPPYFYDWSSGSNLATAGFLFSGDYYATVTDKNDCPVFPHVFVQQPPKIYVTSSDDQVICHGGSATLESTVIGGNPPYSYNWSPDSVGINASVLNVSPIKTTDYYLTVTDNNNCTGNTQFIKVKVDPLLSMEVETIYDTICPGEPVTIRANISGGNGGPYMLYLNNGTVVAPPFDVYPTESQTYVLTLHDRCETPAIVDSIHITVLPSPVVNPVVDKYSGCAPLTLHFIESSPNDGQTYVWRFGDGLNSEGSIAKNPVHTFRYSGTYNIYLTVQSKYGCISNYVMDNPVTVYPVPDARFYPTPEVVSIVNSKIDFVNLSVGADSAFWSFGDGDSSLIFNPSHYYRQTGVYRIDLIAETIYGCTDTTSQIVKINEEFTVFFPTAFSPNNDGINDEFAVIGNGIHPDGYDLLIYNRWGEIVFETKDKTKKWDGKLNSSLVPGGVYTWVLYYKNLDGIGNTISGKVTVIR